MRKLFVALLLGSAIAGATSISSVNCSVTAGDITQTLTGAKSVNCSIILAQGPQTFYGPVTATAAAADNISGLQGAVSATTNAGAPQAPPGIHVAATAQASDSADFYTTGPLRPGFIHFDIIFDYLHQDLAANAAVAVISDTTHRYNYSNSSFGNTPTPATNCNPESCEYIGSLPLEMGGVFDILASGHAVWPGIRGADGSAAVNFSLFEADGSTPVAFFAVPEPSTSSLLFFGLAACALCGLLRLRHTSETI